MYTLGANCGGYSLTLDLFALATNNATGLEDTFSNITGASTPEHATLIRDFALWVENETLISINVKLYVVGDLLTGRPHLNTYESALEAAALTGQETEDLVRLHLSTYYVKRTTFDRAFVDGERFRYGALYVGGAGLPEYAPYCLVLAKQFQDALTQAACLSGDSLKVCFRGDTFDEDSLKQCAAPFRTHRHVLVAIERAKEVTTTPKGEWPNLIAGGGRYFEVVFIGKVSLADLAFVSTLKSEYDRMLTLLLDSFGKKLDEAGRANAHDFRVLLRGVKEGKLRLEVVA